MTITLGGITISSNMYLGGVEQAKQIAHQTNRTVEGLSITSTVPTPAGRSLTLESTNINGAIQGIWCQNIIDEVKELEAFNNVVELIHNGTTYDVRIIDTSNFNQMYQWEPVVPTKKYTGKILMVEV